MDSKHIILSVISFVFLLQSCVPEFTHDYYIENKTNDTLRYTTGPSNQDRIGDYHKYNHIECIYPNQKKLLCSQYSTSKFFDITRDFTDYAFRLYRHDTCIVVWTEHWKYLPDTAISIYNVNAWHYGEQEAVFYITKSAYYKEL